MARIGTRYSTVNILVIVVLICMLAVGPALGQRGSRGRERALEDPPARPQPGHNPWPWFIAFILLGLACYPAFKNSKRELSE